MPSTTLKLLFIDDDAFVLSAYQRMLHKSAYQCYFLQWPEQLWSFAQLAALDMVIVDQQMPGITGTNLLLQLQQRFPAIKRILITGDVHLALQQAPTELEVAAVLAKPCSKLTLTECIEKLSREPLK